MEKFSLFQKRFSLFRVYRGILATTLPRAAWQPFRCSPASYQLLLCLVIRVFFPLFRGLFVLFNDFIFSDSRFFFNYVFQLTSAVGASCLPTVNGLHSS